MRIGKLSVQTLVVATLLFATANAAWASEEFAVIVNSSNDRNQMDRREVRGHYLLQTRRWGTHDKVAPVDQEGQSEIRESFLATVLRMNRSGLKRHWIQQQYQNALRPAIVVKGDSEVIAYVATNRGAIGFVRVRSLEGAKGVKRIHAF